MCKGIKGVAGDFQKARANSAAAAPAAPTILPATLARPAAFAVDEEELAEAVLDPDASLLDALVTLVRPDADEAGEAPVVVAAVAAAVELTPSAALICAWTVELNVPDILLSVNLAEKAW